MVQPKKKKKKPIEGDRFYTPEWLVKQCIDFVLPVVCLQAPKTILEPSAGTGRFVRALRARYEKSVIAAIDLMPPSENPWPEADESLFGDYLDFNLNPNSFDLTVGNPPFTPALEMIAHALTHSKRVVFLLRQGFLSSSARAAFFRKYRPAYIFIVANRPAFDVPPEVLDDPVYEWVEGQTDQADYCFVCWDQTRPVEATLLDWLPDVDVKIRKGAA